MPFTSNSQTMLPIDFSTLKFSTTVEGDQAEEESGYDSEDEYAFTTEYTFTVADPNPPPPGLQDKNPFAFRTFVWSVPLVTIRVRTINRTMIPPGQFYSYMDNISNDFLQFSMGVFNKYGHIKPSFCQPGSPDRGTGVWGSEIDHGTLAYIESICVSPKYQRRGVGRWAVETVLKSDFLAYCPFVFLWAAVCTNSGLFAEPNLDFESKKQGVASFWRAVGFRRLGGSPFFGYARKTRNTRCVP